jgi:hypothetical protein
VLDLDGLDLLERGLAAQADLHDRVGKERGRADDLRANGIERVANRCDGGHEGLPRLRSV